MSKLRFAFNILAIAVFSLAISSVAQAQATRTWVSGVGDDANPCSRTAPCKTFAGAISKTAPCGEISVLDPGGFGAVTITKAITINGDGTLAGILAANVNGIIVNAGVNDVVILRSLSINGACSGLSGIRYLAGKHLHVENCTIYDFLNFGIEGANTSGTGTMAVLNTSLTNTGVGIRTANNASTTTNIHNCRVDRSTFGIDGFGGNTTVTHSVVSHQSSIGIVAENSGTVTVDGSSVEYCTTGVSAFTATTSKVNLRNSIIVNAGAGTGISIAAGATVASTQDNINIGSAVPGAPNAVITKQ